jgi:hypothetical protein
MVASVPPVAGFSNTKSTALMAPEAWLAAAREAGLWEAKA